MRIFRDFARKIARISTPERKRPALSGRPLPRLRTQISGPEEATRGKASTGYERTSHPSCRLRKRTQHTCCVSFIWRAAHGAERITRRPTPGEFWFSISQNQWPTRCLSELLGPVARPMPRQVGAPTYGCKDYTTRKASISSPSCLSQFGMVPTPLHSFKPSRYFTGRFSRA